MTLVKIEIKDVKNAEKLVTFLKDIDYVSKVSVEHSDDDSVIPEKLHNSLKESVVKKKNPAFAKHI